MSDPSPDDRINAVKAQAPDAAQDQMILERSFWGGVIGGAAIAAARGGPLGVAIFGAGLAGGKLGSFAAHELGVGDWIADGLVLAGLKRVGQVGPEGPHPATVGHQVAHSYALEGFLASIVLGALAAAAAAAFVVLTCGVGAVALVGAAAAGGLAGGFVGTAVSEASSQVGTRTGPIKTGSPNFFIQNRAVARMTDKAECSKEGGSPTPIIEGSRTIFVNGLALARVGHKLLCDAVIDEGAASVIVDESTWACATPQPAVPVWAQALLTFGGLLLAGWASGSAANMAKTTTSVESEGVPQGNRNLALDPVDVVSGEFVEWRTDVHIDGILPFTLKRHYASARVDVGSFEAFPGLFGSRWRDSLSVRLVRRDQGRSPIDYHDDEGVCWTFDTPDEDLAARHLKAPNLVLEGTRAHPVLRDRSTGLRRHFLWGAGGDPHVAHLTRIVDARGNELRFVYDDSDGRFRRIEHSDGYTVYAEWHAVQPNSRRVLSALWLVEPGEPSVELVRYQFDEHARLSRCASESSGQLRYVYDDQSRMVEWGDASETRVVVTYGSDGRVCELRSPLELYDGRFVYDVEQHRTEVWNGAHCTTYTWDKSLRVTAMADPLGNETRTAWGELGRRISQMDSLGRTTRYAHTDDGLISAIVDSEGRVQRFKYDDEGRLVERRLPDGRRWAWTYDPVGDVSAVRTPDDLLTRFERDERGRVSARIAPDGARTSFHYDQRGRPCAITRPNGAREVWQQDRLGRVHELVDALEATTRFSFDDYDPRVSEPPEPTKHSHVSPRRVELPTGDVLHFEYNREGLPSRRVDAAGSVREYRWGPFDLLLEEKDPLGHRVRYEYGPGARLSTVVNERGELWRYHYDAAGRLIEEIDFAGKRTHYERDPAGRVQVKTLPDGTRHRYVWSAGDQLLSIDAGGACIEYVRDAQERLLCARLHRGAVVVSETKFAYDEAGRVVQETQISSGVENTQTFRYDTHGRRAGRDGPLGSVEYQRGLGGEIEALLTEEGEVHILRDLAGRPVERRGRLQEAHQGMRHGSQHGASFRLHQHFDSLGRLLEQQLGVAEGRDEAQGGLSNFGDSPGNHGLLRHYHWDRGRLARVDDTRFGSTWYKFDAREQVTSATFSPNPTRGGGLTFDPERANPTEVERFRYDEARNLSVVEQNGERQALLVDRGGAVRRRGRQRLEYDARGRVTHRIDEVRGFRPRAWRYAWDEFDRLVRLHTPEGAQWEYTYDAFGRRTHKRCLNSGEAFSRRGRRTICEAHYLWDGEAVVGEWKTYADGTPAQSETLAWYSEPGSFVPLGVALQRDNDLPEFLHVVADHLGTPKNLVSDDGRVLWAARHNTWGHLRQRLGDRGQAENDAVLSEWDGTPANEANLDVELRFANQWEDAESGLFYNLNRYYDAENAQYLSPDPIGLVGGLRPWGYVENPTRWIDPLGLNGCPPAAAEGLPDSAVVCRGGTCTADRFANGSGVTLDDAGRLQRVSVNAGETLEAASTGIPNGQVGATTAGQIRAAGGEVVPSATLRNPNHATMSGVTPQQAEQLFTPTVPNPSRGR